MTTPTVGIIGCAGRIGRVHTETIVQRLPEVRLKWLCDLDGEAARTCASEWSVRHSTADYRDILNDAEVDAVLICTATPTHVACIVDAAEAKKHVFCEKPVDLEPERIVVAIDTVRRNNVKLQVGFMKRFDPEYGRLKAAIDGGRVGTPSLIRFSSRDPSPPPAEYIGVSGGLFRDMTCHDFDLVRYLSGSEVVEVSAFGDVHVDESFRKANDVDTAVVSFRLANGAIGCIDNSRKTTYGYDQRVEFFGSEGCVLADHVRSGHVVAMNGDGILSEKPVAWFMDRYRDAYIEELHDFCDVLRTDRAPRATADDGLRATLIALASRRSLDERRVVAVDYSLCGGQTSAQA